VTNPRNRSKGWVDVRIGNEEMERRGRGGIVSVKSTILATSSSSSSSDQSISSSFDDGKLVRCSHLPSSSSLSHDLPCYLHIPTTTSLYSHLIHSNSSSHQPSSSSSSSMMRSNPISVRCYDALVKKRRRMRSDEGQNEIMIDVYLTSIFEPIM